MESTTAIECPHGHKINEDGMYYQECDTCQIPTDLWQKCLRGGRTRRRAEFAKTYAGTPQNRETLVSLAEAARHLGYRVKTHVQLLRVMSLHNIEVIPRRNKDGSVGRNRYDVDIRALDAAYAKMEAEGTLRRKHARIDYSASPALPIPKREQFGADIAFSVAQDMLGMSKTPAANALPGFAKRNIRCGDPISCGAVTLLRVNADDVFRCLHEQEEKRKQSVYKEAELALEPFKVVPEQPTLESAGSLPTPDSIDGQLKEIREFATRTNANVNSLLNRQDKLDARLDKLSGCLKGMEIKLETMASVNRGYQHNFNEIIEKLKEVHELIDMHVNGPHRG